MDKMDENALGSLGLNDISRQSNQTNLMNSMRQENVNDESMSFIKVADRENMNFGEKDVMTNSPQRYKLAQEEIEKDYQEWDQQTVQVEENFEIAQEA